MVEHNPHKVAVVGSIPSLATSLLANSLQTVSGRLVNIRKGHWKYNQSTVKKV